MHRLALAVLLLVTPTLASQADAAPHRSEGAPVLAEPAPPTPPTPPVPPMAMFGKPGKAKAMTFSFSTGQGRLGAQVSSMTPELREFFGAPKDRGILVQSIRSGTPAATAGLAVGDVVVAVDGEDIEDVGDVMAALADRGKGDTVEVAVIRKKKRKTLSATLDEDDAFSMFSHGASGSDQVLEKLEAIERRLEALESKPEPKRKAPPKKRSAK